MSGPTTTNPVATPINAVIDDAMKAAEQLAITAEETALDAAVPIFAAPVIKQITDEVLTLGTEYIGKNIDVALQQFDTFVVIDTETSGEKTGISQALGNLMTAEKSGDSTKIAAAIKAYQEAQSALQNDDGSATPST